MANVRYKFFLRIGSLSAEAVEIVPVWKDEMALEWSLENGQWFYRNAMSGNFNLIRKDYDLVMSQPFNTVYYFSIFKHDGSLWKEYWLGKFCQTDCTVNTDDRRVTVKIEAIDDYNDILSGWEKEYDLIRLAPAIEKVQVTKRPMVQIYSEEDTVVSCFCGTTFFEEDVSEPTVDDLDKWLVEHCHFETLDTLQEINFAAGSPEGFGAPFTGHFVNGQYLTNSIGTYRIKYFETWDWEGLVKVYTNGLQIMLSNSDTVLWEFWQENDWVAVPLPADLEFYPRGAGTTNLEAVRTSHYTYGRVVCNVPVLSGADVYPIERDDLVPYNRNYRYCTPYKGTNELLMNWQGESDEPTQWGMKENGKYFTQPYDDTAYAPIARSKWMNTSDWFKPGTYTQGIDLSARYVYTLNDAYPIASVIGVLLGQVAPDILFDATSDYSEFLYGSGTTIGSHHQNILITPKSNITAGEYQTPAMTAPVTLKTILDMLAKTFHLHWMIQSVDVGGGVIQKRLRIEHVEWFRRGGTYSGTQQIGMDLTAIKNVRNEKTWDYATSEYSFDKEEMPERYQFGWMDEVTTPFKGLAIEVLSPFVDKGKIEEVNVSQFSSDIDLMLLNPNAISPDGFAVMTSESGAIPFVQTSLDNVVYKLQNGYLAFCMLQDPYWLYDMPAKSLKVNGQARNALGVSRNKSQTVNIPYDTTEPNLQKLVTTGIGNGQIRQLSIRLTSRMAKVTLRYDTEQV